MYPVYVNDEGSFEVTEISYDHEGRINKLTYRLDNGKLVFVDDNNYIMKMDHNEHADLNNAVIWHGRNEKTIAKVSQMIETKTNEHNALAHDIVDCEDDHISRKRRDEYYEVAGMLAGLYEVLKVVE